MNISRPNMKYQLIAKDIHNYDKVRPREEEGEGGYFDLRHEDIFDLYSPKISIPPYG